MAANEMREPLDHFLPTGSWGSGRDFDILYIGKDKEKAREVLAAAYEELSSQLIAESSGPGSILVTATRPPASFRRVPRSLSPESMAIVLSDLPDFGYADLEKLKRWARSQLANGIPPGAIEEQLALMLRENMLSNIEAQLTSSGLDYYRGVDGQQWWVDHYLKNPEKVRLFGFDNCQLQLNLTYTAWLTRIDDFRKLECHSLEGDL